MLMKCRILLIRNTVEMAGGNINDKLKNLYLSDIYLIRNNVGERHKNRKKTNWNRDYYWHPKVISTISALS